jgi:hypothetical protein
MHENSLNSTLERVMAGSLPALHDIAMTAAPGGKGGTLWNGGMAGPRISSI